MLKIWVITLCTSDGRDLNYDQYVESGDSNLTLTSHSSDYNSNSTERLDIDG